MLFTEALIRFSEFIANMAQNQPRDKNGRWTKVGGAYHAVGGLVGTGGTGQLHTDTGFTDYLQSAAKAKGYKLTPLTIKKLQMLNPQGLAGSHVTIPSIPVGKDNQAQIDFFMKVLPAGTKVKSKYVTTKHVEDWEAKKGTSTPAPLQTTSTQINTHIIGTKTNLPDMNITFGQISATKKAGYLTDNININGNLVYVLKNNKGDIVAYLEQQSNGNIKSVVALDPSTKFDHNTGTFIGSHGISEGEYSSALNAFNYAKVYHFEKVAPPQTSIPSNTGIGGKGLRPLPPINYSELTHVGPAPGGSTGATIAKDSSGKKFIIKKPNPNLPDPQGFIDNEINANRIYRAAGVDVPHSGPVYLGGTSSGMRSQFLEGGQTYKDWSQGKPQSEKDAMRSQIAKNFVLDALLGNHDVIGQNFDNIMVHNGKPVRIDNGGAMAFRAQGQPKVLADTVEELKTMRDPVINPQAHKMFKYLTDQDIRNQIYDLIKKKNAILSAVPPSQFDKINKRFEHLESIVKQPATVSLPLATGNPFATTTTTPNQTSIPVSSTLPTQPLPFGGKYKVGTATGKPILQIVKPKDLIETGGSHKTPGIKVQAPIHELEQWKSSIPVAQRDAVKDYTSSAHYGPMRDKMGAGPPYDAHTQAFLDGVAAAPQLKAPTIIYRGVKGDTSAFDKEHINQILDAGVGGIWTENAAMSTSRQPSSAAGFTNSKGIFFEITSKTARHIENNSYYKGEAELIALPNVKYKITKIVQDPQEILDENGNAFKVKLFVHMEEI